MAVGGIGWGQAVSGPYARADVTGRYHKRVLRRRLSALRCASQTSAKVLPTYLQMRLENGESRRSSSERSVALKQAERAGKTDRG